jgi:uncharacterized protein YpbB
VLNGLTHFYKVENGQVYKGKVTLQNTGNTVQNVKIFLQDFSYHSDGTTYYTAPHTNEKSNTDWIKLNTNLVSLKAKEKQRYILKLTFLLKSPSQERIGVLLL